MPGLGKCWGFSNGVGTTSIPFTKDGTVCLGNLFLGGRERNKAKCLV
jgi:hypothetical protein